MLDKNQTEQLFEIADKCDWLLEKLEKAFEEKEEENKILKKALELAVNCLQREIDGGCLTATEVQVIYEIDEDYFIEQAKESLK